MSSPLLGQAHNAPPTDWQIEAQVQKALHNDHIFVGSSIMSSVDKGVVKLTGIVRSETEKEYASSDLANIPGVKTVLNNDVILHDRFEAHLNRFSDLGATVLNLVLPLDLDFVAGPAKLDDPDAVVRTSEADSVEAVSLLICSMRTVQAEPSSDWPDLLAADIKLTPSLNLSCWSELHGLTPWAVSRGFSQVFGISPRSFRARMRARQAWKAIETDRDKSLSTISANLDFADQPHMSRHVKMLTGQSPATLRSHASRFKTPRILRPMNGL